MAVIAGQVPPTPAPPAEHVSRVVVKFRPYVRLPYTRAAVEQLSEEDRQAWNGVSDAFPGVALAPYFTSVAEPTLRRLSRETEAAEAGPRLTSFYGVACPQGVDPQRLARAVAVLPGVELAYVEAGPTPPPVNPVDDLLNASQGYQDAAPAGIDARWSWGQTDGTGIGVVDLERGWTLDHEDLAAANVTLISGSNTDFQGHGTAVLGQMVGVDNALGVVGIAPGATPRVVSQWRTATDYSTADAITSAVAAMSAGDVLLIEAQTTANGINNLPVEVEAATFAAIQAATLHGVTVVEAGGNGSTDLDTFQDTSGELVLARGAPGFRDSGAVLVGAGSSAVPHSRLPFSNFGSRIDCYAWGENITTTGDGWMGTTTTSYTASFGGTSGATPIVAGAAVLLQSWRTRTLGQPPYAPARLRELLSETGNTPSANPETDRIGVMPNMRRIIEGETPARGGRDDRWMLALQILFGITQDGGGLGWVPGRGPIPVGPWGPLESLAPDKRDILVGLAMTELAGMLGDEAGRRELDRAALNAMRKSLDRLGDRT